MSKEIRNSIFNLIEGGSSGSSWKQLKALLNDGNTVALYDRTRSEGVVKDINGRESIYWDLMTGSLLRGAVQSSGVIIVYAVYEIIVCQADFFYVGNQVGDIFPCGIVKICDANNKVKRVLGNHLTQPVLASRPINGIFDGVDDFMKVAPFTYDEPQQEYIVFKSISNTDNDAITDGDANYSAPYKQKGEPITRIGQVSGTASTVYSKSGVFLIAQMLFNQANSYLRINKHPIVTVNLGATTMGGFTLGSIGTHLDYYSNIHFMSCALRNIKDSAEFLSSIYNKICGNYFGIGAVKENLIGFICDDNSDLGYTLVKPLLETYGFKGCFAPVTSVIGNAGTFTVAQLLDLQSEGHEIMSHTVNHINLTTIPLDQAITEIVDSKNALEAMGLNVSNLVYPFNGVNIAVAAEVLKVYNAGFAARTIEGIETLAIPLGRVDRLIVDTSSLATLETAIDTTIATNGSRILILYGHPATWDAAKIQDVTDLCVYIQSKGLTINTGKEIVDKVKSYKPNECIDY